MKIRNRANGENKNYVVKLPFGEEIGVTTPMTPGRSNIQGYGVDNVRQKFSGKERDTETGLDYFLARYYSNQHGRFINADPVNLTASRIADPQQLNLYVYTSVQSRLNWRLNVP